MPSPPRKLNLDALIGREDVAVTADIQVRGVEDPSERAARLRREQEEARHLRRKDMVILVAVLVGVAVIVVACFVIVVAPGHSADDKKWATSILTAIDSGGVGYLSGKRS